MRGFNVNIENIIELKIWKLFKAILTVQRADMENKSPSITKICIFNKAECSACLTENEEKARARWRLV